MKTNWADHPIKTTLLGVLFTGFIMVSLFIAFTIGIAHQKGWQTSWKNSLKTLITNNKLLPDESNIRAEDLKAGDVVIYLRYDCKDCHRTWPDLKQALSQNKASDEVYIVYTRTKLGKQVLKQYPITDVPSGIYIKNKTEYIRKTLHKNKTAERQNLERLLELHQKSNR